MTNVEFLKQFLRSGFLFGIGPDRLVIGWGDLKKSQKPEGACSIYAPDFYFENPEPWLIVPEFKVFDRENFTRDVLPKMTTEVKDFHWIEPERSGFDRQFLKIQNAFKTAGLKKAVPVVHARTDGAIDSSRLVSILNSLSRVPSSLTPYGFWSRNEGVLGATPEFLFSIAGNEIKTMALAGTRAKAESDNGAKALMNDSKERHEHQLVIDDIVAVLSNFGEVQVGETFAAELPTLFHLKTEISAKTNSPTDFETLARALHPTPALGLSPRSLGVGFLKNWDEVERRGRFGAPFGVDLLLEDGVRVQDCGVGIRNIQWNESQVQLGSGCGIVPESQIDREWSELKLKRDSVRKILGL